MKARVLLSLLLIAIFNCNVNEKTVAVNAAVDVESNNDSSTSSLDRYLSTCSKTDLEHSGFINDLTINKTPEEIIGTKLYPFLKDGGVSNIQLHYYPSSYVVDNKQPIPEYTFDDVLFKNNINLTYLRECKEGETPSFTDNEGNGVFAQDTDYIEYGNTFTSYKTKYANIVDSSLYDPSKLNIYGLYDNKKVGFSSIQGISLISNTCFIDTAFDLSLKKSNIYLALKQNEQFDINFNEILNELSKTCINSVVSYPFIVVDGEEKVSLLLNGQNAYFLTHNCRFYFDDDNDIYYLSLPFTTFIERITFSVPFVSGGFYNNSVKKDGLNNYYSLSGDYPSLLIDTMQLDAYMNSFVPYLWGGLENKATSFQDASKFIYRPITIESINYNEKTISFKSNLANLVIHSIDILDSSNRIKKYSLSNQSSKNNARFDFDNYVKGFYWNYTCSFADENLSFIVNNVSQKFVVKSVEYLYPIDLLHTDFINIKCYFSTDFQYRKNYSANQIYAKINLDIKQNPRNWFENLFNPSVMFSKDNKWYSPDYGSYYDYLYFDFYKDSAFEQRVNDIITLNVHVPLKNNKYRDIYIKDLETEIANFRNTEVGNREDAKNYYYFEYLESIPYGSSWYDLFFIPSESGQYFEGGFFKNYFKFDDTGLRFVYSNYTTKNDHDTYGIDGTTLTNHKMYAFLTYYTAAGAIVKGSTADGALHEEFDENGVSLGIFTGDGEYKKGYTMGPRGYIVDDKGNIIDNRGEVTITEDKNIFDKANDLFTEVKDFFTKASSTFKNVIKISVIVVIALLAFKVVSLIISLFKKRKR